MILASLLTIFMSVVIYQLPCSPHWSFYLAMIAALSSAGWGAADMESFLVKEWKHRKKYDTDDWQKFRDEFDKNKGGKL